MCTTLLCIFAGCYPTNFTVNGAEYHKICGKVRGYQRTTTDAFGGPHPMGKAIDEAYVDGVSITLANPRRHVWTYASGYSDDLAHSSNCPCSSTSGVGAYPFIGEHYYCESGTTGDPLQALLLIHSGMAVDVFLLTTTVALTPAYRGFTDSSQQHNKMTLK